MTSAKRSKSKLRSATGLFACTLLLSGASMAWEQDRDVMVLTSTNQSTGNEVLAFKLQPGSKTLSLVQSLPTGGKGGAAGNAGILQFGDDAGAVANYGSNTVSRLMRHGDSIGMDGTIELASECVQPDSVALVHDHLFVVGKNCAETHRWPSGALEGGPVHLTDPSAAQIAVGRTWAAITFTSGSVWQLPLNGEGELAGTATPVSLPASANNTPLGAAFWEDILGFNPAHSADSFALVDARRNVYPVVGPTPAFPSNAPCWLAKGPGNIWYSGNSPGMAISIFFSDGKGGAFYKSIPLPGVATDVSVSHDGKWLAVIYSADGNGYVGLYSVDAYGDLELAAASAPAGVPVFSGVAVSN